MNDNPINSKYHVITVEKTTAPEGISGENWYLYVIQKGKLTNSIMQCKKSGTLESVTEHAQEVSEIINSRNNKRGRK